MREGSINLCLTSPPGDSDTVKFKNQWLNMSSKCIIRYLKQNCSIFLIEKVSLDQMNSLSAAQKN